MKIKRLGNNPIIHPGLCPSIGTNINGPTLVRAPEWVSNPLGCYYLYFADHRGSFIRLAYADELTGPWQIYRPGTLHLNQSCFPSRATALSPPERLRKGVASGNLRPHVASPDVHIDNEKKQFHMYFHGLTQDCKQRTRLALSSDGINFKTRPPILGLAYFRAFVWADTTYGLAMPGVLYRSDCGGLSFEEGPQIFHDNMRHLALRIRDDRLDVVYSRVGDTPERLLHSKIPLQGDWRNWKPTEPMDLLRPQEDWEGGNCPIEPSLFGPADEPKRQLRDPAFFNEDGKTWLLYSVAGEAGIAIAKIQ